MRVRDRPVITIDAKLRGEARVRVEFHELAHHFLHRGEGGLLRTFDPKGGSVGETTPAVEWAEVEADAAALVALAPDFPLVAFMQIVVEGSRHRWGRRRKGGAR